MSFDKLCDIYVEHEYYNSGASERLEMQLVPSIGSRSLIRKNHIVVRNKKNLFSIYGDVFTEKPNGTGKEPKRDFKLSFALIVSDPYFLQASNLLLPEREDLMGREIILEQGNSRAVYYFHNDRDVLIDSKAFLSNGIQVDRTDMVYLNPLSFTKEGLKELDDLCLLPNIAYDKDDKIDDAYSFYTVIDPADTNKKNSIFEADFSPFGSGIYAFTYSYKLDGARKNATTSFYLNNEFYGLRPFAVIDLFFYKNINDDFKLLKKDLYLSITARESFWRYNIISKHNKYDGLKIISEPSDLFPQTGVQKTMKNGETAIVFESQSELKFKQVAERFYGLSGIHIETLGIVLDDEDDGGGNGDNNGSPAAEGPIQRLPNPKVENLVLEKLNTGTESEVIKPYSDLFVYI